MDWDDLYIEYDELVEAGEIDPVKYPVEEWIIDKVSEATDRLLDSADMER
jgi:acyl CoA:acetate/3-ketoacid CoA transferase alpha subunit